MKRVTGIGGIFFKAKNPAVLHAWYKRHLGIDVPRPTEPARIAKAIIQIAGGHQGMTKKWLSAQGLVFLRYLWGDLAPLRRTA